MKEIKTKNIQKTSIELETTSIQKEFLSTIHLSDSVQSTLSIIEFYDRVENILDRTCIAMGQSVSFRETFGSTIKDK